MKIQKIKEIKEALDFMAKTGDVSKIALDNLTTGLEELDEQFSLYDVVSTSICENCGGSDLDSDSVWCNDCDDYIDN